jgi:hypothetical protein
MGRQVHDVEAMKFTSRVLKGLPTCCGLVEAWIAGCCDGLGRGLGRAAATQYSALSVYMVLSELSEFCACRRGVLWPPCHCSRRS